jgi:hypothetical protein
LTASLSTIFRKCIFLQLPSGRAVNTTGNGLHLYLTQEGHAYFCDKSAKKLLFQTEKRKKMKLGSKHSHIAKKCKKFQLSLRVMLEFY